MGVSVIKSVDLRREKAYSICTAEHVAQEFRRGTEGTKDGDTRDRFAIDRVQRGPSDGVCERNRDRGQIRRAVGDCVPNLRMSRDVCP